MIESASGRNQFLPKVESDAKRFEQVESTDPYDLELVADIRDLDNFLQTWCRLLKGHDYGGKNNTEKFEKIQVSTQGNYRSLLT